MRGGIHDKAADGHLSDRVSYFLDREHVSMAEKNGSGHVRDENLDSGTSSLTDDTCC